jgi:fructose-1,6-bisphosphatase/sedoheptulose 1,7-bisphosphatase-like protein
MIETTDLSLEFLRVVEQAAIASARTMGQGGRPNSNHVAIEAMRRELDAVPIDGTIVIGGGQARCAKTGILHVGCSDTGRVRF